MRRREIEYFLGVVEHGSFTAAAAAMFVSQPALSQGIRSLERAVDAPLFERAGRVAVLTAAGSALVGPARQILTDLDAAAAEVAGVMGLTGGSLTVACSADLAVEPLIGLCATFRAAHPAVRIEVIDIDRGIAALLHERIADIAVAFLPIDDKELGPKELGTLELGDRTLRLIVPPGAHITSEPYGREQLAGLDLVSGPPGTAIRDLLDSRLADVGARPRIVVQVQNEQLLAEMVGAGAGAALVRESVATAAVERGWARSVELNEPWTQRIGLAYARSGLGPATAEFLRITEAGPFIRKR